MKSVTEFQSHTLTSGLKTKAALTAEGKTPEEVEAALGTAHKYEGDKLKYFTAALAVAEQNQENLSRVLVVSLTEGETAPPKAVKVEEHYFVPEFRSAPKPITMTKTDPKGRSGGPKKEKGGMKTSPWGLTPEEKAAKGKGAAAKAKATT